MGKLKYLVIHCTATPEGREVTKSDIEDWHIKGNGWSRLGYSDLIQLDGTLVNLREFDQDNEVDVWEITNGVKGYNDITRHVVYAGGCSTEKPVGMKWFATKDTRTDKQIETLTTYVKYMILRHPDIKVVGHNQLANKACPSFDVPCWLEDLGIDQKNIGL